MSRIDEIIDGVIGREGRYSNNPNDTGGETMWGITIGTARACGYHGAMRDMPRETAASIYRKKYIVDPGFADVLTISSLIAEELVDTGVNMGPAVASIFLQRLLNAMNGQGRLYNDIIVDGDVGTATLNALRAYIRHRGPDGIVTFVKGLNALQGARYIELAEKRQKNEAFLYGWLRTRL
jgi:lysozyme family protein